MLVLGPFIAAYTEPEAAPVPSPAPAPEPSRVKIDFRAPYETAIEPGGLVHLVTIHESVVEGAARPVRVHVFYVPHDPIIDPKARTVEAIANSGAAMGSIDAPADAFDVRVAGVKPGLYDVHTLIDYPS